MTAIRATDSKMESNSVYFPSVENRSGRDPGGNMKAISGLLLSGWVFAALRHGGIRDHKWRMRVAW